MDIRIATSADDELLVSHSLALWDSYGTPADDLRADAHERIAAFIADQREHRRLGAFIASVDGEVAGSIACGLRVAPYPEIVREDRRLFGYIWSVFVIPHYQRRGIGRALVERALDHLRAAGCTAVSLNSSDAGAPLYASMGFTPGTEMRLALT